MSTLVSTTCAKDGTIRTFTLDGDALAPLATSQIGDGVSAMAPDASGRRAWVGTKEPQGIPTLELDVDSGVWTTVDVTPELARDTIESLTVLGVPVGTVALDDFDFGSYQN